MFHRVQPEFECRLPQDQQFGDRTSQPSDSDQVDESQRCTTPHGGTLSGWAVTNYGLPQPVLKREHYNYAPAVMKEGQLYRMWWGGGVAGDFILYSQAKQLGGPWRSRDGTRQFDIALRPTNDHKNDDFDAKHTCDPSVVWAHGQYFLYYGGLGYRAPNDYTQVGVAVSNDGVSYQRLNHGRPIVEPARRTQRSYGAGQPAVFFHDANFYMAFTDTTGYARNPKNLAGIYCMRSPDPTFTSQVEELTTEGFAPWTLEKHTRHRLTEAFSVDWIYLASLNLVAIGVTLNAGTGCAVRFRTLQGKPAEPDASALTPTKEIFREGPGIVRSPEGHALMDNDVTLRFDVIQAMCDHSGRTGPNSWDLGTYGARLTRMVDLPDSLVAAPGLPLALIVGTHRIQFDSHDVPAPFAKRRVDVNKDTFFKFPCLGSVRRARACVTAPERPIALTDKDKGIIFPVNGAWSPQAGVGVEQLSKERYDSLTVGPRLTPHL